MMPVDRAPTEFQIASLGPGEMPLLLEALGLRPSPASLLWAAGMMSAEPSERSTAEIISDLPAALDRATLADSLAALAQPAAVLSVRRGARRVPPATMFVAVSASGREGVVVDSHPDGSANLLLPFDRGSLTAFLTSGLRYAQAPEIPLGAFPPLSPEGLAVVLALADLFRGAYPEPDPEWFPDAAISFRTAELYSYLQDGWAGLAPSSLVLGYGDLVGEPLPQFSVEALESLLYVLANENLLHLDFDADEETRFTFGESLTWALRCMAWWDLTLAVTPWPGDGVEPLVAIQASGIWRFAAPTVGPPGTIEARVIGGEELERELDELVSGLLEPVRAVAGARPAARWAGSPIPALGDPQSPGERIRDLVAGLTRDDIDRARARLEDVLAVLRDARAIRSLPNAGEEAVLGFNNTLRVAVYAPHDETLVQRMGAWVRGHLPGLETLPGPRVRVDEHGTQAAAGAPLSAVRHYRLLYQNASDEWMELPHELWQEVSDEAFAEVSGYSPDKLRGLLRGDELSRWEHMADVDRRDLWARKHGQLALDQFTRVASLDYTDQASALGAAGETRYGIRAEVGDGELEGPDELGSAYLERYRASLHREEQADALAQSAKVVCAVEGVRAGYEMQGYAVGNLPDAVQHGMRLIRDSARNAQTGVSAAMQMLEAGLRAEGFSSLDDFILILSGQFGALKIPPT